MLLRLPIDEVATEADGKTTVVMAVRAAPGSDVLCTPRTRG